MTEDEIAFRLLPHLLQYNYKPMAKKTSTTMEELLQKEESLSIQQFNRGDVVKGEIISISEDGALVDVGAKAEGVIPTNELKGRNLKAGDTVFVFVLTPEDRRGQLLLSISKAETIKTWIDLKDSLKNGTSVEAVVTGSNKGGLTADINGLVGFIPFSHAESVSDNAGDKDALQSEIDKIMNETIKVQVIELDQYKERIILSEKEASLGEAREQRLAAIGDINVGDEVTANVSAVMPYGLMIELGEGLEGLVPREEISWDEEQIDELLAEYEGGETVKAEVITVDTELGRVELSMKAVSRDPWSEVSQAHNEGDQIDARVTRITSYGVFVEVDAGVEGMVGISSIPEDKELTVGQKIPVTIDTLDPVKKRLDLSYNG